MIKWQQFLETWSIQLLQTDLAKRVQPSTTRPNWLGYNPASEREINELERRLGVQLPPSYKSFLRASNGWRQTTPFVSRIRPCAEVDWFHVENLNWVEIYAVDGSDDSDEEYYAYDGDGASDHRAEHMCSLLQISDVDDGVYLLNPQAVTSDGEWEAWFFANWIPGATRFPSFAHLLVHEYRSFAKLEGVVPVEGDVPALATLSPQEPRTSLVDPSDFEEAMEQDVLQLTIDNLTSEDEKTRDKAVKEFAGRIRGRNFGERRPDLVEPLTSLYYSTQDARVRGLCVQALTEFAEGNAPPAPLLDALSDSDPGVVLAGIWALHYFPNSNALEPLCRFIESRQYALINESAMGALREFADPRAVPALAGVLLDANCKLEQSFSTAAMALAACGKEGFEVLASAMKHADPRIRRAAVVGLDIGGRSEALPLLDQARSDPDPNVRQRAHMSRIMK